MDTGNDIVKNTAFSLGVATLLGAAMGTPLAIGLVIGAGMRTLDGIGNYLDSDRAKKYYKKLIEEKFIKDSKNKVKDYITDDFLDLDCIALDVIPDVEETISEVMDPERGEKFEVESARCKISLPDGLNPLANKIKVKKEHALYFMLTEEEINIIESPFFHHTSKGTPRSRHGNGIFRKKAG